MQRLIALFLACLCGGCAIPFHRSIIDQPPFDVLRNRVVATNKVTYLFKKAQEPQPEHGYPYFLTPLSSSGIARVFVLSEHTKLRITAMQHLYYPLEPVPFDEVQPRNFVAATIVSGPYTGVRISSTWGDTSDLPTSSPMHADQLATRA